jgi:hypothetical protein
MTRTCRRVLVGFSAVAAAALTPATASGVAPVRQCPENFPDVITRAEALEIDGAVIFDAVNKNGDDIICFKPFANKDGGVVKDNTAVGPKS